MSQPENFLLTSKGPDAILKATDFGLSRFYKDGVSMDEIVGSPFYVAPEVRGWRGPIGLRAQGFRPTLSPLLARPPPALPPNPKSLNAETLQPLKLLNPKALKP